MIINFELTGLPEKALIKIATANETDPSVYAKGVLLTFLNKQVRGHYQGIFNNLTTQELIQLFGDIS